MSQVQIVNRITCNCIALVIVLAIAIALTLSTSVTAATIRVPADQPVIQAALWVANNGDTVLVAPGTYTGDGNRNLDFGGRAVLLRSESGAAATILDCQATSEFHDRVVILNSGEDSTTVIDGFTMTGAWAGSEVVYIENGGVKLVRCSIINNGGYGVRQYAITAPFHWLVIDSCTITGNGADGVYANRNFAVRNSNLSHNIGNGLYAKEPTTNSHVSYSIFEGNGLAGMAGTSFAGYMAYVTNCTFVGNTDGLACIVDLPIGRAPVAAARVQNCIMAFNSNRGYDCGGYVNPGVVCSDAFGNGGKNWNTFNSVPPGADTLGNMSLDPMFCDRVVGNLALMNSSPCSAANNGCGSLIGAVDVGCVCCQGVRGNVNMTGVVDLADLSALVNYLTGGGYVLPCEGEANVNGVGIVDLADLAGLIDYLGGGGYVLPSCM
jgi:hypothetical protein